MYVSRGQKFLLLNHDISSNRYRVSLCNSLADSVADWGAASRLSPIWVCQPKKNMPLPDMSVTGKYLLLAGPINPWKLTAALGELKDLKFDLWLTLGVHNVVLVSPRKGDLVKAKAWLDGATVCWELWHNKKQAATKVEWSDHTLDQIPATWRDDIARLLRKRTDQNIKLALREFGPLLASSIARAEAYDGNIASELYMLIQYAEDIVRRCDTTKEQELPINPSVGSAMITTMNAGLSRFSSQAFSGTAPIFQTESHFWAHSLLGIGIANIGLANLTRFISTRIGKQHIPTRFEQLANRTERIPDFLSMESNDPFWQQDYLAELVLAPGEEPSIDPDISFFSGRDGFKAHLSNISVPLTTVFSAASERWSLKTITHEISHKILKGVLSQILPMDESPDRKTISLQEAETLIESDDPQNWLDAIRLWLWENVPLIQHLSRAKDPTALVELPVLPSLVQMGGEIEEIVVHVFDFLYFYEQNEEAYLREIWLTWSVIPNISKRVPEYVIRSVCAVLAKNLPRLDVGIDISIERVRKELDSILEKDSTLPYIQEAIDYIDGNTDSLYIAVEARIQFVHFVRTFLYSEEIAQSLLHESRALTGDDAKREGYGKQYRLLDGETLENPLKFISAYSTEKNISEAEAAWVFYNLAFNVIEEGRGDG